MKIQFLTLFWGVLMACSAAAQRLEIDPPNNDDGIYTFRVTELPPLAPNPAITEPPFYYVFWLFGDGEYAPLMDSTTTHCWKNYSIASKTLVPANGVTIGTTHGYQREGQYTSSVFLTDRKGGTPPPPEFRGIGDAVISVTNPTARVVRNTTISEKKRIYLAHSLGYLRDTNINGPGDHSVFIISYKPDPCLNNNSSTKIHLFYGRKTKEEWLRTGRGYIPSAHFTNQSVALNPNYGQNLTVNMRRPNQPQTSLFSYHDIFELPDGYVEEVLENTGRHPEQRLFQQVQFNNVSNSSDVNGLATSEWSYALAVLTSSSIYCKERIDTISSYNLLNGVSGYNSRLNLLDGQYIIDIDTIHLKSGEPDDPNDLKITKICSDGSIHLQLHFCNKPTASNATGARVNFNLLSPESFKWCGINSIQYAGRNRSITTSQGIQECKNLNAKDNRVLYNCESRSLSIPGNLDAGECGTIDVVLKVTNADLLRDTHELKSYLVNNSILTAAISFCPSAPELTVTSKVVNKGLHNILNCQRSCQACKVLDAPKLEITNVCSDGSLQLHLRFCNESIANNITGTLVRFKLLDPNSFKWCKIESVEYAGKIREIVTSSDKLDCENMGAKSNKVFYNCANDILSIPGNLAPGGCIDIKVALKITNEDFLQNFKSLKSYLSIKEILAANILVCPTDEKATILNGLMSKDFEITKDCSIECSEACCNQKKWFRRWWCRFINWF